MANRWWIVCGGLACLAGGVSAQDGPDGEMFVAVGRDSVWVGQYRPAPGRQEAPTLLMVPGWPAVGSDVLGLGRRLSDLGSHVFILHPRGHGTSSGTASFRNAIDDVDAVLAWLASGDAAGEFGHDPEVVLAGYSWGGGIALAYAGGHPSIRRVIAIAGSDHGAFIRRFDDDPDYGAFYRAALLSTQAPSGPVRFDLDRDLDELRNDRAMHDLVSIAPALADRDLLLFAGWDDAQVEMEHQVLPFYRALRRAGAETVRVIGYQDDHGFGTVRAELASDIRRWLVR